MANADESNTLRAPSSTTGFKFVDPDGTFAERAFDLAVPMRMGGRDTKRRSFAAWPPSLQSFVPIYWRRASANLGVGVDPVRFEWLVVAADGA